MSEMVIDEGSDVEAGAQMPDKWVIPQDNGGWILNLNQIPQVLWTDVRKGYFFVAYGTGNAFSDIHYFESEDHAERLFNEFMNVSKISMLQLGQVVKAGYRPNQMQFG